VWIDARAKRSAIAYKAIVQGAGLDWALEFGSMNMAKVFLRAAVAIGMMGIGCAVQAQTSGAAGPVNRPPVQLPPQANPRATDVMAPNRGIAPGPAEDATSYKPVVAQPRPRLDGEPEPAVMRSQPLPKP